MERKPHVLRGPLLILVTFALVLALIATGQSWKRPSTMDGA